MASELLSDKLSSFLELLSNSEKDLRFYEEEIICLNQLTQDYLHKLEFQELSDDQKLELINDLQTCRLSRREAKDGIQLLEPIVTFLMTDKGKMTVSQLQQILGKVRKAEKTIENRRYTPRILEEDNV